VTGAGETLCDYSVWDARDHHMVHACARPGEPVEMADGGTVHVCIHHRSWLAAMSRVAPHYFVGNEGYATGGNVHG
jgi:hypothetical protein